MCLLKVESCSYLMFYARLTLNFFIKVRGLQIFVAFPILVRFPVISSFYREHSIVDPINQFLIVKLKLLTLFQH